MASYALRVSLPSSESSTLERRPSEGDPVLQLYNFEKYFVYLIIRNREGALKVVKNGKFRP